MNLVGYARVSTTGSDLALQHEALTSAGLYPDLRRDSVQRTTGAARA